MKTIRTFKCKTHDEPPLLIVVSAVLILLVAGLGANDARAASIKPCSSQKPSLNPSKDICKELCTNGANYSCSPSGVCLCEKEPTPTSLGGGFVHCTNWNYVEQKECKTLCEPTGKNDTRVCWTVAYGNYCACF